MAKFSRPTFSKLRLKLSAGLLWQAGFALLALVCVALAANIWLSGGKETKSAIEDGRRLLITIADGSVSGKIPEAVPTPAAAEPSYPQSPDYPESETYPDSSAPDYPASPEAQAMPDTQALPAVNPPEQEVVDAPEPEQVQPEAAPEATGSITPSENPPHDVDVALTEKTKAGLVPAIGKDGTKPWKHYAKPFDRKGKTPMIAIIVTGLGQNKTATDEALKLPEAITLSFSPYAKQVASWGTAARVSGHESLLDLPLQTVSYPASDPGPYGILIFNSQAENEARLNWLMSRVPVFVGFISPQNEGFSSNTDAFKELLQELGTHGLMLAISREPAKDETKAIIDSTNTPLVMADALLDEDLSPTAIQTRLATLEQLAKKRGYAVGIAQGLPLTLGELKEWSAGLQEKGVVLAPVSAVAKLRFN